jgi:hypothetical protein
MKINVTKEDIQSGNNPIKNAIYRQHGLEAIVDRKYIQFVGNERFPRRLPLSAEDFQYKLATGQKVDPFEFEIGG